MQVFSTADLAVNQKRRSNLDVYLGYVTSNVYPRKKKEREKIGEEPGHRETSLLLIMLQKNNTTIVRLFITILLPL